jgi:molybdenum cofactor biosynthesis protein B
VSTVLHRKDAPASVRCFVLTVSDTRTPANDASGDAIASALQAAGHVVAGRQIVTDDPAAVRQVLETTDGVDAVITTGGTGIAARDGTYEAVSALFDKTIDGFGELFRVLSYEQVGSAAMMSRACAGSIRRIAVFALPGSEQAVRLAMEKLILPELGHVVRELRR